MHLILALMLAIAPESLAVRLVPVRTELARAESLLVSGLSDSAGASVASAGREWSGIEALADSSPGPEGWHEGEKVVTTRFAAFGGTATPRQSDIAALSELLYWLPRPKPVLLKFTGYKCEKCVVMEQVLSKVAADYSGRALIRTIDVNEDEENARRYRVTVVPTMVFLDASGNEVSRAAREMTDAEVRSRLELLLLHD